LLSKFNEKASAETKVALLDLKQQGATKIILDLRGNPGGLLNEAVNICNLFVAKNELIVTTKSKNSKYNSEYRTKNEPSDIEIPLVVIVDGKSASASEIVAGAIQDLDRGVVLGSRSFGKGLVQRPLDLSYGTQVKVTISRYYTPSGRCIQALDYSKKDENGKAIKKTQNEFNAFKTKAGRTVYDGGGVLPDVEIAATKMANCTDALLKNDAIFNFATQLYYKNPTVNGVPTVSDVDFMAFKNYLKQEKINLDSDTHKALKTVLENAKKEKIESEIAAEYKQLEVALEKSQETELDKNKEQIKKHLQEELIIRHQYREGLYLFYTKNNPEIEQAINLLNNSNQYKSILKK
jgi:carboxyl-terminal processing protease